MLGPHLSTLPSFTRPSVRSSIFPSFYLSVLYLFGKRIKIKAGERSEGRRGEKERRKKEIGEGEEKEEDRRRNREREEPKVPIVMMMMIML